MVIQLALKCKRVLNYRTEVYVITIDIKFYMGSGPHNIITHQLPQNDDRNHINIPITVNSLKNYFNGEFVTINIVKVAIRKKI
ncbi:hypothetical protein A3Q56_02183 [Intoshia linei]|uniref:Uncharacterized protein n=1 Tax=Intoshia linei TaxID=1819745 RepID=A0A177B7G4_9BILA|nr:hypothetical protein A3Q56_02183 [Intoshia linei]